MNIQVSILPCYSLQLQNIIKKLQIFTQRSQNGKNEKYIMQCYMDYQGISCDTILHTINILFSVTVF